MGILLVHHSFIIKFQHSSSNSENSDTEKVGSIANLPFIISI